MEQIHGLLYAIIALHTKSDTGGDMSPSLLNDLGKFTGHKIYTFVEAQQEKNMIKKLFRTGEMTTLFKYCQTGLKAALDVFKIQDVNLLSDVAQMQRYAEHRHLEVLELIHGSSDAASSIDGVFLSSHDSSNSISMLPSEPKIFHGRDTELADILRLFMQETARVAILGAGGMGKTSLARAVLHHPDITDRYGQYRVFVPCDSVSTQAELAALIGAHLGVKQGKNLTKAVVQQFSRNAPSLLILDNLETLWEPTTSRADIEYVQKFHYPGSSLLQPLVTHFYGLLDIQREYSGTAISGSRLVPRIRGNFANIQNILLDSLHADNPDIVNAIRCTLYFDGFMQDFGYACIALMNRIPEVLPHPPNHTMELLLVIRLLGAGCGNRSQIWKN
ncbi:hypothetical protein C8R43DRAFT_1066982 [Mycena crocata]|nr:hypothetical protein C8R43DRAFT_1066982 [Mycena crocata]